MRLKKQIQKFIVHYLVIFAILIIINSAISQLFFSQVLFDGQQLLRIMLFALISTLPSLILRPTELSKKRLIAHFVVLEFSVVSLGVAIGAIKNLLTGILYVVVVGFIYVLIRFLYLQEDKAVANQINEKLKNMKYKDNDIDE